MWLLKLHGKIDYLIWFCCVCGTFTTKHQFLYICFNQNWNILLLLSNVWAGGLPDCAPGKCPKTAEISPIKCSSDPVLFFNNGYPMLCQEGFTCDSGAADAGEGNPCRAAEDGAGYEWRETSNSWIFSFPTELVLLFSVLRDILQKNPFFIEIFIGQT